MWGLLPSEDPPAVLGLVLDPLCLNMLVIGLIG